MTYNFPETIFTKGNTARAQALHVHSEVIEFLKEILCGDMDKADIEAADLYHSIETYFRIRENEGVDLGAVFGAVTRKNEERGYYKT